jgi:hypothetical protein
VHILDLEHLYLWVLEKHMTEMSSVLVLFISLSGRICDQTLKMDKGAQCEALPFISPSKRKRALFGDVDDFMAPTTMKRNTLIIKMLGILPRSICEVYLLWNTFPNI